MKKILIVLSVIIVILCLFKSETIIIPKESIRFRIIASSNEKKDQYIKQQVVKNLQPEINTIDFTPKNIEQTRISIQNKIPKIKENVKSTLNALNQKESFKINYGMNYFPEKVYKGVKYEEGEYESLVIELGDGLGDNFWCVLFPPLCLLEGEEYTKTDVEYTSFIKEIINKYF